MKILFVQTGGTIDKDYPKTTNGWGFEIGEPAVRRLLEERLNPTFDYEFVTVCQKDSTQITDQDRLAMGKAIEQQLEQPNSLDGVIVTHGTDTLIETATYLATTLTPTTRVPIILTGAMRPERFTNSDADCNVGMAIGALQMASHDFVGICMHGRVLSYDKAGRDLQTGKFIPKV